MQLAVNFCSILDNLKTNGLPGLGAEPEHPAAVAIS